MEKELKIFFTTLLFLILVFVFKGFYSFFYPTDKKINQEKSELSIPLISQEKWKEFKDENIGIFFKYPADWIVYPFNWSITFGMNSGHWESYATNKNFSNVFLRFMIFQKNYFSFYDINFAKKKVNPNWTKEQFLEEMEIPEEKRDNIFFVKKLNEKSLLVAFWEQEVLDPFRSRPLLILNVLVPWSDDFPNLEIRIHYPFLKDIHFSPSSTASNEEFDFYLNELKKIVPLIERETYSDELNEIIRAVDFISQSVQKLK